MLVMMLMTTMVKITIILIMIIICFKCSLGLDVEAESILVPAAPSV